MILKLKRTPGIYLVGFMGSGKTTVGEQLAYELGWTFSDIDAEIEVEQGVSIAEIFDTRGEPEFRRVESEAIRRRVREIERGKPMVVALGGGAFVQPANVELLVDNGVTVWLDCPFDVVHDRIAKEGHRPLARDPELFRQLFLDRRQYYERAEYTIETASDDTPAIVAKIMKLPIF